MGLPASSILILGHTGLVGQALLQARPGLRHFNGGRRVFDITQGPARLAAALAALKVRACINCAAMSQVDICEQDRASAYQVNSQAPADLAMVCRSLGIRFLHLSTDYVFDGSQTTPHREKDQVRPLSVYGQSKLAGEEMVLAANPQALVVRTAWVFGLGRPGFVERPWQQHLAGQPVRVVDDQVSSPTWAPDLAQALLSLTATDAMGLLHVAGSGQASRWQVAAAFFRLAGLDPSLVKPAKSADFAASAPRPAYSALDCSLAARHLGRSLLPWPEALARHWRDLQKNAKA